MITALQLLKDQLKSSHDLFLSTGADIKEADVHTQPGGMAFPIGATYAHLVFSEDAIVQGMIQGKAPLFTTEWKEKTGASAPMPNMDQNWDANNKEWNKTVKIDMAKLHEYEKAVFAATDAYVSTLKDEDLDKEIDLGAWGKKTVAVLLSDFIISHCCSLAGEISVLKGVQGSKGYPF